MKALLIVINGCFFKTNLSQGFGGTPNHGLQSSVRPPFRLAPVHILTSSLSDSQSLAFQNVTLLTLLLILL